MKTAVKSGLKRIGLYQEASNAWMRIEPWLIGWARAVTGRNRRLASAYLAASREPKLHIGCGANHLPGWLNTELCPHGDEIYLDATRPFPLPSNTFAFVYSEHMIEHIPYEAAGAMLAECFRILRPGGVIRIVTPDLAFLRALLGSDLTPEQLSYLDYSRQTNNIQGPVRSAVHVVNHFVRAWGHQFIYDQTSLVDLLAAAGFHAAPVALAGSDHTELTGLAKFDRMPEGFLEMESLVVEGRKPAS